MKKLKNNNEIKEFCLKIIHSESVESIKKTLKSYDLWDNMDYWRYYGDASNNISTINNQAPDAEKALVEKISNSCECLNENCTH